MDNFAKALAPDAEIKVVGIRPGEKMHEAMISVDDARNTREYKDHYRIIPEFGKWEAPHNAENGGQPVPNTFSYTSNNNTQWLEAEELRQTARIVAAECGISYEE